MLGECIATDNFLDEIDLPTAIEHHLKMFFFSSSQEPAHLHRICQTFCQQHCNQMRISNDKTGTSDIIYVLIIP